MLPASHVKLPNITADTTCVSLRQLFLVSAVLVLCCLTVYYFHHWSICVCVIRTSSWPSWRIWNRRSWTKIFWKSKERTSTSLYPAYHLHHYHLDQVRKEQFNSTSTPPTSPSTWLILFLFFFFAAKKKVEEDEDDMADLEAWAAN